VESVGRNAGRHAVSGVSRRRHFDRFEWSFFFSRDNLGRRRWQLQGRGIRRRKERVLRKGCTKPAVAWIDSGKEVVLSVHTPHLVRLPWFGRHWHQAQRTRL
jgi:hypothetical protein